MQQPHQSKVTKWICRLILSDNKKILIIPSDDKKENIKYELNTIYDVEHHVDELKEVLMRHMNKKPLQM